MRYVNLLFGVAFAALTLCSSYSVSLGQEEGKRGPPGGGERTRGGPPGGFSGRGGGGIMSLLRMEEVQKEINITEDQKKELTALGERLRESFGRGPGGGPPGGGPPGGARPEGGRPEGGRPEGGRPEGGRPGGTLSPEQQAQFQEMMERAAEARNKAEAEIMTTILDPDQGDRILGLLIQKEDGNSLTSNVLADALGLSPEQKQKVKTAAKDNNDERMKLARSAMGGGGNGFSELREKMDALTKKLNTDLIAVMTADQKAKFESMKGTKFTFPEQTGFGGPGGGDRTRGQRPGGEGGRPARPAGPEN
jgi:Spy/CpxP family protein refolding chaperone